MPNNTNVNEKRVAGEQIRYRDLAALTNVYVIDYACTGNSGRSPLAEAIATDKIRELGLEGKLLAISSGTKRAVMDGKEPPLDLQYMVLQRAIDRNDELKLYDDAEVVEVRGLLADRAKTTSEYHKGGTTHKKMRGYEARARSTFTREEHEFRERATGELGIQTRIKHGGQQTEPHTMVRFFYGLAPSNEDAARRIYRGEANQPAFSNLAIENNFGLPYDRYIAMAQDLKAKVESTVAYAASMMY